MEGKRRKKYLKSGTNMGKVCPEWLVLVDCYDSPVIYNIYVSVYYAALSCAHHQPLASRIPYL